MTVIAKDGYVDLVQDKVDNFHGNQVVYVSWDDHLLFCAAQAFPLPPEMPFKALVFEVIPTVFSWHKEFEQVDWAKAQWNLDGNDFVPDMEKSLAENGVEHKSVIRFKTPGLTGIDGTRM